MPKTKKMTPAVLAQIPTLLERGVTPLEIARMIGCTLGTLRVICSKSKISLRQNNRRSSGPGCQATSTRHAPSPIRRPSSDHHQTITLELPKTTATLLRQQAGGQGLSVSNLAARLLETIVQDGLYEAVLDNRPVEPEIRTLNRAVLVLPIEEGKGRVKKRHAA